MGRNKESVKMETRDELMAWVSEAEKLVEKYGWQDKEVRPYPRCPIKVTKILRDCKDYDRCTRGTKDYLLSLATGLKGILEAWERNELAPKVTVKVKSTGKVIQILEEDFVLFKDLVEVVS